MGEGGERFGDEVGGLDGFAAETAGGAKSGDGAMGAGGEVAVAS